MIETGGPGGAEQMLLRLADEYGLRGIPQMVCLRKDGWLAGEVSRRGLFLEILPLGRLPDFSWLKAVGRITKKHGVKAIHAHEFGMNVRGAMLGVWFGIPVVATNVGGISEIINQGNGLLLPAEPKPQVVASALSEFVEPEAVANKRLQSKASFQHRFAAANNYRHFIDSIKAEFAKAFTSAGTVQDEQLAQP